MLNRRHVIVCCAIAIGIFGLTASPSLAASSDALDQSFVGTNTDGSFLSGSVNIPTLTAGSPVTGSGYITISEGGTPVFTGTFTATTLKSLKPDTAAGFAPILKVNANPLISGGFYTFQSVSTGGSAADTPFAAVTLGGGTCTQTSFFGVCTAISVPTANDLFIYCPNAGTLLDIGVTLAGSISISQALNISTIPGGALAAEFPNLSGVSTNSLC